MTVREMRAWIADEGMFPDPNQRIDFRAPDNSLLHIAGQIVQAYKNVVVELQPTRQKKFLYEIGFSTQQVITAADQAEADEKIHEMVDDLVVKTKFSGIIRDDFVAKEPKRLKTEDNS
jgi:hypothetical protein